MGRYNKATGDERGVAARRAMYGRANQISYEADERLERSKLRGQLSEQRTRAKARGAAYKANQTGMNAGTAKGGLGKNKGY